MLLLVIKQYNLPSKESNIQRIKHQCTTQNLDILLLKITITEK
jgi:hypothetical protein